MNIYGGTGQPPIDVALEGSADTIGDVLSIHLSQDADSAAVWIIGVRVLLAQGWFRLGQITTNTVAVDVFPARCVGFAACPGARGWAVEAYSTTDGEAADLVLQSSKGSAAVFGVSKNVLVPP